MWCKGLDPGSGSPGWPVPLKLQAFWDARETTNYGSSACRTMTPSWRSHWLWRKDSCIRSANKYADLHITRPSCCSQGPFPSTEEDHPGPCGSDECCLWPESLSQDGLDEWKEACWESIPTPQSPLHHAFCFTEGILIDSDPIPPHSPIYFISRPWHKKSSCSKKPSVLKLSLASLMQLTVPSRNVCQ